MLSILSRALAYPLIPQSLRSAGQSVPEARPFSRFVDVAGMAGLTRPIFYGASDSATFILEVTGCGCAFIDYDNDGWMDIFLPGGRRLDEIPAGAGNRLYHNNRDGTFTDVTAKAGLETVGWPIGVCVGDYDNDGFDDLFITYYGQNRLWHNNGNGTFTDATEKAGLMQEGIRFGSGCTFIERNRNGLLDLFVAHYVVLDLEHGPRPSKDNPLCNYSGIPVNCGPLALPTPHHLFYRNNGDGTFTDISQETGVAKLSGSYGLTAVVCDVDEDGWPDIIVACDQSFSFLLMNNHDGTFREEGLMRGVAVDIGGQLLAGMGIGVGDCDLSGHLDIVRTHFYRQPTGLYLNDGHGNFRDDTLPSGLAKDTGSINWGTGLVDFDNDGWPDIFVASGTVYPELAKTLPQRYPARTPRLLFRNGHDGRFERMGDEAGPGIAALHNSRGAAFGDFDNDGDIDILVMNRNEPPSLLRNDAPAENRWIKVRLVGTKSNRSAIGARVIAHYGGKVQARCVTSQCSFVSASDPRVHFGLGMAEWADIDVFWPSGARQSFQHLAAGQLHILQEGKSQPVSRPLRESGPERVLVQAHAFSEGAERECGPTRRRRRSSLADRRVGLPVHVSVTIPGGNPAPEGS